MKRKLNYFYSVLTLLLFFGLSGVVNSISPSYSGASTMSIAEGLGDNRIREYGSGDNVYSSYTWSSLSSAMAYYGHDYTYNSCNYSYSGIRYNYYFSYSDNSRCYFRVRR